jgi:mono/diheme cytochrome c family protein
VPGWNRVVFATLLAALPMQGAAQSFEIGEAEYKNSCAACHGAGGAGDGVLSGYLSTHVPDLTTLQRENGGVFPFARLYEMVERAEQVGAHGTSEMPAWGARYTAQAPQMVGEYGSQADREAWIRGRILALVEYISSLQVD